MGSGSHTVLVTGATGYLGGLLSTQLQRSHSTHLLVRSPLDDDARQRFAASTSHLIPGNAPELVEIVRSIRPDVVFHCAAFAAATHDSADIPALVEANITLGTVLADALASLDHPTSFVNVGTYWQHAAADSDAYAPRNLYAATKQAFQDILTYYALRTQVRAVTVKLFDTYGPGDPRGKLVDLILGSHRGTEPLRMSPGEQRLDLLHVDDVVRGLIAAWRHCTTMDGGHEVYSLASPNRVSVRELVELVERASGTPPNVTLGELPYRAGEIMVPWSGDPVLPGWHSTIDLPTGLATLIEESPHE